MNNMKKRLTGLFMVLVMLTLTLLAIPVSAAEKELTEEEKTALAQSAEAFVETSLYGLDDASLDAVKAYGDFYEVLVDAWRDNRDELGDYVGLISDSVDTTEENIYVTMMTEFTNYDAEVIMYFDKTASQPVNFVINIQYSLGEKMAQAGVNTITGILIVFFILLFLAFLISLFKYVNPDARRRKPAPTPVAVPAPKKAAPAPVVETVDVASNDEEIIAVIAAAIAAAEADGTATGDSYVVRSIKRVGNTRSWKRA